MGGEQEMTVKGVILMILAALLSAVSQVLLKISARKKHSSSITEYLNIYVILGYGILALTMLMTTLAYGYLEYKYGPVLLSSAYAFVLLSGWLFLKEKLTVNKVVGTLLIVAGIIVYGLF
jgi:drug/metabolite transporter (DMT)-like permease